MEAFGQRGPQRPYIYVAPKGLTYQINPQLLFQEVPTAHLTITLVVYNLVDGLEHEFYFPFSWEE